MDRLPENRALLDRYRRADPRALERLFRAYLPEISTFIRCGFRFRSGDEEMQFRGFADRDELREAVQETFLKAFSEAARRGYDGLRPFGTYLRGIARNVVIDRYRKNLTLLGRFQACGPQNEEPSGEAVQRAAGLSLAEDQPPDPQRAAEQSQLRRIVRDFVAGLSETQQQIVRLHFMERLGQEATGEALALGRGRVRKEIKKIRKKLLLRLRRAGLNRPFAAMRGVEEEGP